MNREHGRMQLVVPELQELVGKRAGTELREVFEDYEPVEIAQILREFSLRDKVYLFSLWDIDFAADIFAKLDEDMQIEVLGFIDDSGKSKLLNELAPDKRVDLFEELPTQMVDRFLKIMAREEAQDTRALLAYPSTSAGGLMTTEYISVRSDMSATQALAELRDTARDIEMVYYIYVLNSKEKLVGVLSLKELILAPPESIISNIAHENPIALPLDMDQEDVARRIANYDFLALPVVDHAGKMKGIITVDDVIDVIEEEDTEDMYKFGAAGEHSESYLRMPSLTIARNRITWLVVLVATGFVSGLIMQHYSFALESIVALAFYIPVLTGTAGNAGTQAAMAVVRGLAIGEVSLRDVWRIEKKELIVGAILGVPLGLIALLRALLLEGSSILGVCVAFSMLITIISSTFLGSLLPLLCKRLNLDPAVVSGPLMATVLDVLSLVIYFGICTFFLGL